MRGMAFAVLAVVCLAASANGARVDSFEKLKREAVNRERLVIWDDDGCDMTHYPYKRADLVDQPASVRNFELVFLEATENTRVDVIGYSGTMGFGYFTALRTGGYVNTNRFVKPWRNAVNEFAAMGKDAMDLATDFARRNKKEIFLSLRFNDDHDNGYPEIMLSPFKKDNPEVMVGHGQKTKCCGKNAADFAQEKVRAFVKKYVRGYMENYDLDGIEFDFFRHPQLFRTVAMGGHATKEELAMMTRLMKDFRSMAEEIGRKRGRPFVLCARVPDSFEYCRAIGIDLDAWLRAKALDFLVVGGYFQLEPWRKTADRVHGYGVRCYASLDETRIDQMVRRQKGKMLPGRNDKECWIARIAAAMASGMDGVNLFNIEYFKHDDQRYIMKHDIRRLDGIDKTYFATYVGGGGYLPEYFLVGGRDYWKTTGVNPAWPVKLAKGEGRPFEFVFGDDLAAAKRKGKSAKVEVFVLTDLKGTVPPVVKVRGKALVGGVQKDGIATFVVGDACFAKGENAIEVVALEDMSLLDFSVKVSFGASHLRGNVSESARYERLHPRFAKAFAFMRRPDLAKLPCGRYEIDGSNCWATISNASLKPFSVDNKYEVHRAFIDIQTPITGCETIGVTKPDPKVFEGFNVEGDYVLFNAKGEPWTLKPEEFAIFFPCGGAHAPGLSTDGPRTIRKLVVKVRNL